MRDHEHVHHTSDRDHFDMLLEAVGRGDQQAFAELFEQLNAGVLRRIKRVLRDPAISEEVMQEVFLEVWRQAARYSPERGSAVAWILARAHSRAVDTVRSVQAQRNRDEKVGLLDYEPGYDSVSEKVELRATSARVNDAILELPAPQREAVVLSFYDGYSHSEVSAMLGVPLGTVKSRIHQGMVKLRQDLAEAS